MDVGNIWREAKRLHDERIAIPRPRVPDTLRAPFREVRPQQYLADEPLALSCKDIIASMGGSLALKAFVDNAEPLGKLELGGQKFSKDDTSRS